MKTKKKENKVWSLLAPIVVLVSICLVITAALAATNMVTKPIIDAAAQSKADEAMKVVLADGSDFQAIEDLTGLPEIITSAANAGNGAGYVFTIDGKGFDKGLVVMVGIDAKGTVAGVSVLSNNETAGIGSKVVEEGSAFLSQLPGMTNTDGIEAVSGATMTSNGMKAAIQAAFDANVILSGGSVEAKMAGKPAVLTAKVIEGYFPGAAFTEVDGGQVSAAGTIVYGEAQGMESVVGVAVFFDPDGKVLGVAVDALSETEGLGTNYSEKKFTDGLVGITSADDIDVIASATITGDAVKAAVKQAFANLNTVKGAA